MPKWIKKHRWSAIVLASGTLLMILFIGSLFIPLVREICTAAEHGQKPDCNQHHLGPYIFLWIALITDAHNGLVSAIAAVFVAIFTAVLYVATDAQGKLTQKSIDLAREEFLTANPPHLVVRNVHCRDANPGDNISISFEIINNGKSDAHIVASAFRTNFVNETETFHDLPLVAVGEPPKNALGDLILIPSAVLRPTFDEPFKWRPEHFHNHGVPTAGYFFGGKILYRDAKGNQRRLGFLRRLSLPSRRFRPVNDPEFEYDD